MRGLGELRKQNKNHMEKRNELRDNKRRSWSQNRMSVCAIESRHSEDRERNFCAPVTHSG
jgi:hypothetical protein